MNLSRDSLQSLVAHLAHLRAEYGDALSDPDLVEPNGTYFPDDFAVDPAGIARLLERMATYAPLSSELDLEIAFVDAEGEEGGGGCGSGSCSPGAGAKLTVNNPGAVETETGYALVLNVAEVSEPTLLTSALARGLGRVVLFEAGEDVDPRDEGALAELTAVASGLGVLLLNGACVYKKGCGGMRRHQGTFLGIEELALAVALFVRVADKKPGSVRRHLPVTQREAFDEALAWVDGQPKLVQTLASNPERLTDGIFEPEGKKGLLSKLFGRSKDDDAMPEQVTVRIKPRSEEELRRRAEAKALVEEALQES
ncbi:hypothetical protein AKJ09_05667 [Labilithrix luteola]|uniref:Uncharacterized protein n=1 Tax=Labilithrix luteola TaxID=1391654 RepID=A0A0K1PZQ1_9BACT|nr:hypothetical protein [Labilithrix luteola]AKU99003.1 hypothetical protein AKJ09_05667 [Labilithrix luteola]